MTRAALAAEVLAEEDRRAEARATERAEVVLPDDLLPGVGDEAMSLARGAAHRRQQHHRRARPRADRRGGDNTGFAVLAPDIQETLGVSDAVLGAIGGAFGVLFLLGSIPLSSLADRYARKLVAAVSMWSGRRWSRCTGAVQNAFWLFMARLGHRPRPVVPAAGRTRRCWWTRTRSRPGRRVFAARRRPPAPSGRALAPLVAGGLAALVADDDGLAVGRS